MSTRVIALTYIEPAIGPTFAQIGDSKWLPRENQSSGEKVFALNASTGQDDQYERKKSHFQDGVDLAIRCFLPLSTNGDARLVESPSGKWESLSGEDANDLVPNNHQIGPEMTNFAYACFSSIYI